MVVMDGNGRPADILLVEDNNDDVVLPREGFERSKLRMNLHHVKNRRSAWRFCANRASTPTRQRPI